MHKQNRQTGQTEHYLGQRSSGQMHGPGHTAEGYCGFTMIELLVVIAIFSLVLAILWPALSQTRHQARRAACAANLRQVGVAVRMYAQDFDDMIPFGPAGRPVTGPNFYTVTGSVTSLLSLENGDPVGLGLLLNNYLAHQPMVFFCPGADQPSEARDQLARVGSAQAQVGGIGCTG